MNKVIRLRDSESQGENIPILVTILLRYLFYSFGYHMPHQFLFSCESINFLPFQYKKKLNILI